MTLHGCGTANAKRKKIAEAITGLKVIYQSYELEGNGRDEGRDGGMWKNGIIRSVFAQSG